MQVGGSTVYQQAHKPTPQKRLPRRATAAATRPAATAGTASSESENERESKSVSDRKKLKRESQSRRITIHHDVTTIVTHPHAPSSLL